MPSSLASGAVSGSVSDWDGSGSAFLRLRGFFTSVWDSVGSLRAPSGIPAEDVSASAESVSVWESEASQVSSGAPSAGDAVIFSSVWDSCASKRVVISSGSSAFFLVGIDCPPLFVKIHSAVVPSCISFFCAPLSWAASVWCQTGSAQESSYRMPAYNHKPMPLRSALPLGAL